MWCRPLAVPAFHRPPSWCVINAIIIIIFDAIINAASDCAVAQIQWVMLFSRQGKVRLQKWYLAIPQKDKKKIMREVRGLAGGGCHHLCVRLSCHWPCYLLVTITAAFVLLSINGRRHLCACL